MRNAIFLLSLILLGIAGLVFSLSKRSACFSPDFIVSDSSFNIGSASPSDEVAEILKQPFAFLGSGNQSYAFESEDHKTVMKLFKFHCIEGAKIDRLRNGLNIAYTYDRINTGLLYVHFPPSQVTQKVKLTDKAGRKHEIELGSLVFVLQRKATILKDVLSNALSQGDVGAAKEKLTALFQMFADDLKKGLYDQDHNIMANTGFAGDQPMRIDFGKLSLNDEMKTNYSLELKKIADERVIPWVKRFYPQYEVEITEFLQKVLISFDLS